MGEAAVATIAPEPVDQNGFGPVDPSSLIEVLIMKFQAPSAHGRV